VTWLRLFWIFLLPLALIVPAFLPSLLGKPIGGLYRQWFAQHLINLLPHSAAADLASWFAGATLAGELGLTAVIVLNIAALAAWPLWVIGEAIIRVSNWAESTHLGQLRRGLRRS
jgi:hypothetical protein